MRSLQHYRSFFSRQSKLRRSLHQATPVLAETLETRLLLSSYAASAYFPLVAGNTWTYSGTVDSTMMDQPVAVTDTKTSSITSVNGSSVTALTDMPNSTSFANAYLGAMTAWFSYNPTTGVSFYGGNNPTGTVTVTLNQPQVFLTPTMTDGQVISWKNVSATLSLTGSNAGGGTGTASGNSTVQGIQTVTANNGVTYQAVCVVFNDTGTTYTKSVDGSTRTIQSNTVETLWLGLDVGIVKETISSNLTTTHDDGDVTNLTVTTSFLLNANPTASVAGTIYDDTTDSGVWNPADPPMSGVTVYLDANNNGTLDPGETSVATDANGNYFFGGLSAGSYIVREIAPGGYTQTSPPLAQAINVSLSAGQTLTGQTFLDAPNPVSVPVITITAPAAGATWQAGTSQTVTWTTSGATSAIAYFDLALSTDNGQTYTQISPVNLSATATSFTFTPTAGQASNMAKILVWAANSANHLLADQWSSMFSIVYTAPATAITITSPSAGANWQTDTSQTVTWAASGATSDIAYFDVALSTNNGQTYTQISPVNLSATATSFTFTPTASQASSTAKILVWAADSGNHLLADQWSNAFTIATGTASIAGSVSYNINGSPKALTDAMVYLDANNNGKLDAGEISVNTDANGNYLFSSVPAGSYTVCAVTPGGYTPSSPANGTITVSLSTGQALTGQNFLDAPSANATEEAVYRLYSPVTLEHLYTTDPNEYNTLEGHVGTWSGEGEVFSEYSGPGSVYGVADEPLYRLYDAPLKQHFWTDNYNEYNTLRNAPWNWNDEGIVGYVFPMAVASGEPLYRMMAPQVHLWTTDVNEYDTLASEGWTQEGVIGYVM